MQHIIRNRPQLEAVFRQVARTPYPLTLTWRQGETRSGQANNMQWQWATEVHLQTAEPPEDVQARWKLEHGVPILRATDDEFRAIYDARIKHLSYEDKVAVMKLGLPVSSRMKKPEMSRYLDAIREECVKNGLALAEPD